MKVERTSASRQPGLQARHENEASARQVSDLRWQRAWLWGHRPPLWVLAARQHGEGAASNCRPNALVQCCEPIRIQASEGVPDSIHALRVDLCQRTKDGESLAMVVQHLS